MHNFTADACRRFHKRRLHLDDNPRDNNKENTDASFGTPFTSSLSTQTDVTLPTNFLYAEFVQIHTALVDNINELSLFNSL
jgi:hypothetical protein